MIGGYIGDKYEPVFLPTKGFISGTGNIVAAILFCVCYILQISFWVSIGCLYITQIFSQCWAGITYSMVNRIFPSELQGIAVGIYQMSTSLAGTLGIFLVGLVSDSLDIESNPQLIGYIAGTTNISAISISIPFFFLAGLSYKKTILRQQKLLKSLKKSLKSFTNPIEQIKESE